MPLGAGPGTLFESCFHYVWLFKKKQMYILKILYYVDYAENNVDKIEQYNVGESQEWAF